MNKNQNEAAADKAQPSLDVLRHSAAHLLAHAVITLYPRTKYGIGPAVENGFYYDFYREQPLRLKISRKLKPK